MPTLRKKRLRLVLNGPAQPQIDNDQISKSSVEVPSMRMAPSSAPRGSTPLTAKNAALSTPLINTQRPPTINQLLAKIKERDNGTYVLASQAAVKASSLLILFSSID